MAGNQPKKIRKKLGKAQAREQFAPLVDALSTAGGLVEVTDYGKVAAVMLGYEDYLQLLARADQTFQPKMRLAGSAKLVGNLETASQKITDSVLDAIERSAKEL